MHQDAPGPFSQSASSGMPGSAASPVTPDDVNMKVSVLSMEVASISEKLDDVLTLLQSASPAQMAASSSNGMIQRSESGSHNAPPRALGSVRHSAGAPLSQSTTHGAVRKVVSMAPGASNAGGRQVPGVAGSMVMRGATIRRRPSRSGQNHMGASSIGGGGGAEPGQDSDSPRNGNALTRRVSFSDPVFGREANNTNGGGGAGGPPSSSGKTGECEGMFPAADPTPPSSAHHRSRTRSTSSQQDASAAAPSSSNAASSPNAPKAPSSTLAPGAGNFGFNLSVGPSGGGGGGSDQRRGSMMDDSINTLGGPSFEVREDGVKRRRRHRNGGGATAAGVGNAASVNSGHGCNLDDSCEMHREPSWLSRKFDSVRHALATKSLDPDTRLVMSLDALYIVIGFLYALFSISIFISPVTNTAFDEPPLQYVIPLAGFNAFLVVWTVLRPWIRLKRGAELVDDPALIREEYFKSVWVVLDVINALPIEFAFMTLSPLAFSCLVARHAVICNVRTLFLAQSTDPLEPQAKQWVLLVIFVGASLMLGHFTASMYWRLEEEEVVNGLSRHLTYTDALYYAIATLTSTGYGDLTANQQRTRTFSSIMMLVGVALISGLTAIVTSVLTNKDVLQEEQDRMRRMMGSMLRHYQIPFSLQREVILHFPTVLNAVSEQGFSNMIQQLPGMMENKIKDYLRAKLLRQVPLFASLPRPEDDESNHPNGDGGADDGQTDVVLELSRKLKVRYTEQWEYIISAGETGEEMYILVHGAVDVLIPTGKTNTIEVQYEDGSTGFEEEQEERRHTTLRSGSFFGEIALIEDTKRTASIQAIQVCELLVLSRADLNEVNKNSPELQQTLAAAVKKRRDEIAGKQAAVISKIAAPAPAAPNLRIADVSEDDADDDSSARRRNPLKMAAIKALRRKQQNAGQSSDDDDGDDDETESATPDDDVVAGHNSSGDASTTTRDTLHVSEA